MSFEKLAGESRDLELEQALKHFKASVDAWSDAAYSRPRTIASRTGFAAANWRKAASWALGCVLATGALAGAVYERQHRRELANIAAMKAAAQKAAHEQTAGEQRAAQAVQPVAALQRKAAAAEPAKNSGHAEDEDLLATVDSDVSRQIPAAMEPLAQLMDDNGTE